MRCKKLDAFFAFLFMAASLHAHIIDPPPFLFQFADSHPYELSYFPTPNNHLKTISFKLLACEEEVDMPHLFDNPLYPHPTNPKKSKKTIISLVVLPYTTPKFATLSTLALSPL